MYIINVRSTIYSRAQSIHRHINEFFRDLLCLCSARWAARYVVYGFYFWSQAGSQTHINTNIGINIDICGCTVCFVVISFPIVCTKSIQYHNMPSHTMPYCLRFGSVCSRSTVVYFCERCYFSLGFVDSNDSVRTARTHTHKLDCNLICDCARNRFPYKIVLISLK